MQVSFDFVWLSYSPWSSEDIFGELRIDRDIYAGIDAGSGKPILWTFIIISDFQFQ